MWFLWYLWGKPHPWPCRGWHPPQWYGWAPTGRKGININADEICRAEEVAYRFRSVKASDIPQAQVNAINFKQKKPHKQHYQQKQSHQPQKQQGRPHDCRFCTENTNPLTAAPPRILCAQHVSSEATGSNLHFAMSQNNPPSPHRRPKLVASLQC